MPKVYTFPKMRILEVTHYNYPIDNSSLFPETEHST